MISGLYSEKVLSQFLKDKIRENNAFIEIDQDLYSPNGSLKHDFAINISVDDFYNSLNLPETPKSIDNLLVINRGNNKFALYLIELKSVQKLSRVKSSDVKEKFQTTIDDFMSEKFKHHFHNETTKITEFNLWLVCNRFQFLGSSISEEDYVKRIRNSLLEQLTLIKPFEFRGKISTILPMKCGVEIC